ncbi:MAG: hypothetical protein ACLGI6_07600, partial [Gammaproteobacteria bacterium]
MCADIDFPTFRASIVREVLHEFLAHYAASAYWQWRGRVPDLAIARRVAYSFNGSCTFGLTITGRDASNLRSFLSRPRRVRSRMMGSSDSYVAYHESSHGQLHVTAEVGRSEPILAILRRIMPQLFAWPDGDRLVPLYTGGVFRQSR